MDNSSPFAQMLAAVFSLGLASMPIIAIVWLFAWIKDIRQDTRKIRDVLKKRFPEEFADD